MLTMWRDNCKSKKNKSLPSISRVWYWEFWLEQLTKNQEFLSYFIVSCLRGLSSSITLKNQRAFRHWAPLVMARQSNSKLELNFINSPVIPATKKDEKEGAISIFESCSGVNLILYSVDIEIMRGYTAEQLIPKNIDPSNTKVFWKLKWESRRQAKATTENRPQKNFELETIFHWYSSWNESKDSDWAPE